METEKIEIEKMEIKKMEIETIEKQKIETEKNEMQKRARQNENKRKIIFDCDNTTDYAFSTFSEERTLNFWPSVQALETTGPRSYMKIQRLCLGKGIERIFLYGLAA